jgi:ABC-type hemin transport system ATPase subunit
MLRPALAAVGLESLEHLPAAYLSAGQRRRLSLARLIAVRARSGCSTSRPPRSILPGRRCWPD